MTRRERILFGAAALLALAIIGWLVLARQLAEPMPDGAGAIAPIALPAAPPPADAAFRRPLFAPVALIAEDAPADAPALTGIVGRIGADAVALVRTRSGETRTLQPGEAVDGWTLQALAIDAAYFTRGTQRVRVPLPAGEE